MKRLYILFSFILSFLFLLSAECQQPETNPIIAPGAKLQKLSGEFSFTEGPATDKKGNVYFTDQPNDRIMVWTVNGKLETFIQPAHRANGLFFDKSGNLWACAEDKNNLIRISKDKKIEVVAEGYNGALFNGPNDVWVAPDGGVYFTDPFYRRAWWTHTERPQDKQCVYYIKPGTASPVRIIDDLVQPNGIIGTPDGKTLYVADISGRKTWKYKINPDGSLSDKTLFCNMGSDGVTLDSKGNLYLTGNGVTVFDSAGKQILTIQVPEKWTANVTFGGKDRKTLFITASGGLYSIRTNVKGAY